MADEQTQGETPEQEQNVQTPPETGETTSESQDDFDKERAMETIKNLRAFEKQAKKQEKELESLRQRVQEQEEAEKTDLQRAQEAAEQAQAERDTALRTANDRLIKAELKTLAASDDYRLHKADAAYVLMKDQGLLEDVEIDENGNVQGLEPALKQLLENEPWLRVSDTQPRAVPASPQPAGQQSRDQLIAQEIEAQRNKRRR